LLEALLERVLLLEWLDVLSPVWHRPWRRGGETRSIMISSFRFMFIGVFYIGGSALLKVTAEELDSSLIRSVVPGQLEQEQQIHNVKQHNS
jgi:hypothetical protein